MYEYVKFFKLQPYNGIWEIASDDSLFCDTSIGIKYMSVYVRIKGIKFHQNFTKTATYQKYGDSQLWPPVPSHWYWYLKGVELV